jgi:spore coat protein U-like protein
MLTMKTQIAIALTAFAAATVAHAQASSSQSVAVSAAISNVCKIGTVSTLSLGDIDPSGTGNVTQTVGVPFKCTNGANVTAKVAATSLTSTDLTDIGEREMSASNNKLKYLLNAKVSGLTGLGFGQDKGLTVELTATVKPEDYANALAGAYQDTILVEVAP